MINNERGKQEVKFINCKLSNDYIRGLTDGEGCFTFYTYSAKRDGKMIKQKMPAFIIAMNVRDRWLLVETAEHLGIHSDVYIHKPYLKDGYKRGYSAKFVVRSLSEIKDIIIPFFYKKLAGYKGQQFFEWLDNIGNDPQVAKRYKIIYELYKSGYWEKEENIPDRLK